MERLPTGDDELEDPPSALTLRGAVVCCEGLHLDDRRLSLTPGARGPEVGLEVHLGDDPRGDEEHGEDAPYREAPHDCSDRLPH